MFRQHVPRIAPTMVAPLVVLQALLCRLRLLVGCCVVSLSPWSPCCLFFLTNMFPMAFTADSSNMTAASLSVTVTLRFSNLTVKGFRTRPRRALNSSKVYALPEFTMVSVFSNSLRSSAFRFSLANSASYFSFFLDSA
jgi:hypothetical protein